MIVYSYKKLVFLLDNGDKINEKIYKVNFLFFGKKLIFFLIK